MSLILYDRPAEGIASRMKMDGVFESWRRTSRAVGGYYSGKMAVKDLGSTQLTEFYNTWLGMKIIEKNYGITTWEGIVWQLDLYQNGINYRRTLNKDLWHNRVKYYYLDANGVKQVLDWSENTDSSDIYGSMEMIYTSGTYGTITATARRDTILTEHAWPLSFKVGSQAIGAPTSRRDGLYVTCVGFWATLGWKFYESSFSGVGDAVINTLVGASEFVTAGRLEDNSGLSDAEADGTVTAMRISEYIEDIISAGDNNGALWVGGVYEEQKFNYKPAPTTVDYVIKKGRLYDKGGALVVPETLKPGFYVRDPAAPLGYKPPGTSNIWDDPKISWVGEVEFEYPNKLWLHYPGEVVATEQYFDEPPPMETPPE